MKVNRDFRYVLTVIKAESAEHTNDILINLKNAGRTGEFMFESECHYYAEKEIISSIKTAEKYNDLSSYVNNVYCIYKERKATVEKLERKEDGKKITETIEHNYCDEAMLIETITVDENGINIR
jgi:hypothetical protein